MVQPHPVLLRLALQFRTFVPKQGVNHSTRCIQDYVGRLKQACCLGPPFLSSDRSLSFLSVGEMEWNVPIFKLA